MPTDECADARAVGFRDVVSHAANLVQPGVWQEIVHHAAVRRVEERIVASVHKERRRREVVQPTGARRRACKRSTVGRKRVEAVPARHGRSAFHLDERYIFNRRKVTLPMDKRSLRLTTDVQFEFGPHRT